MKELIKQERIDEMMKVADHTMAEIIKNLPATIKARTAGVIPAMLGFRGDSWGNKWEVDNCNGRSSELSNGSAESPEMLFNKNSTRLSQRNLSVT